MVGLVAINRRRNLSLMESLVVKKRLQGILLFLSNGELCWVLIGAKGGKGERE